MLKAPSTSPGRQGTGVLRGRNKIEKETLITKKHTNKTKLRKHKRNRPRQGAGVLRGRRGPLAAVTRERGLLRAHDVGLLRKFSEVRK